MKDGTDDANISNYIDVANVLNAELTHLDPQTSEYIDPAAYTRQQQKEKQDAKKVPAPEKSHPQDSIRFDVEGVPPLPANLAVDPKKICPFCHHTFSHPGSLGRHLDLKKGTEGHPEDVITKMRAEVKRRGDKELVKQRRRLKAREYAAREEVKARIRESRRTRDRVFRARRKKMIEFVEKLGRPQLQPHPTFARLVVYFLPPDKWPHDPPTLETHRLLCSHLISLFFGDEAGLENIMAKVVPASDNWLTLDDSVKQEIWIRELRRAAEDALSNTSLFELQNRDQWVQREAARIVENNEDGEDEQSEEIPQRPLPQKVDQQPQPQQPQHIGRQTRNIMMKTATTPTTANDNKQMEHIFNQQELEAVAEAVVNNANKNQHSHLDPRLM